jgi:diguanylate cyclase (GGDEF)-like protein/PAS domain S-box-containing protein
MKSIGGNMRKRDFPTSMRTAFAILGGAVVLVCMLAAMAWRADMAERNLHAETRVAIDAVADTFYAGLLETALRDEAGSAAARDRMARQVTRLATLPEYPVTGIALVPNGGAPFVLGVGSATGFDEQAALAALDGGDTDLAGRDDAMRVTSVRQLDGGTAIVQAVIPESRRIAVRDTARIRTMFLFAPLVFLLIVGGVIFHYRWGSGARNSRILRGVETVYFAVFGCATMMIMAMAIHDGRTDRAHLEFSRTAHHLGEQVNAALARAVSALPGVHRDSTAAQTRVASEILRAYILHDTLRSAVARGTAEMAGLRVPGPDGRHLAAGAVAGFDDVPRGSGVNACEAARICRHVPIFAADGVFLLDLAAPPDATPSFLESAASSLAVGIPLTLGLTLVSFFVGGRRAQTEDVLRERAVALQTSEARFRALLSSIDDVVLVLDRDGRFSEVFVPPAQRGVFAPDELLGRRLADAPLPAGLPALIGESIARVQETGTATTIDFPVAPDGEELWFDLRLSPLRDANGAMQGVIGVARDTTLARRARIRLEQREAFLRLLTALSTQFVNTRDADWDSLVTLALQRIGRFCQADRSYLFVFDAANQTMSNSHEWAAQGVAPQIDILQDIPVPGVSNAFRHLANHETVIINDVSSLPATWEEERRMFEEQDIRSVIMVPVVEEEALIGFVGFDAVIAPREWSALESHLLRVFADILASAMARRRADAALRASETRYREVVNRVREVIFRTDMQGRLIFLNDAFETLLGITINEALGKNLERFMQPQDSLAFRKRISRLFEGGVGELRLEAHCAHRIGETRRVEIYCEAEYDAQGEMTGVFGTMVDITERHAALEEVERLAFFDALTNLPNRPQLMHRLGDAMAETAASGRHAALLFLDLDNFKTLNDTFGHDKGDRLLVEVAERLRSRVGESDLVARLGGDEFVVILRNLSPDLREARIQAEQVAERLRSGLNNAYDLAGQNHYVSPSIGIRVFGSEAGNVETLLRHADLAMYEAKASGRDNIRFFTQEMEQSVMRRAGLEADLRIALQEEEFFLHLQPQVDRIGAITGAEALVRWRHPVRGFVSPADFIPVSEETGLIVPIGRQVVDMACAHLAHIQAETGETGFTMAINISARQFREPDFAAMMEYAVKRHGVAPGCIKLELTESLFLEDMDFAIARMEALREAGFRFSLDDFGTGYSSLTYLKRLPFDEIKVDQAFVADILESERAGTIVETIIRMGRALDLAVIAEGVETAGQLTRLIEGGCEAYQGWFFGRPVALDDFLETLRERRAFLETAGTA